MVVDVNASGGQVKLSSPRLLFQSRFVGGPLVTVANYDVTPDGGFIMMDAEPGHPHLRAILNWTALRQGSAAPPR